MHADDPDDALAGRLQAFTELAAVPSRTADGDGEGKADGEGGQ